MSGRRRAIGLGVGSVLCWAWAWPAPGASGDQAPRFASEVEAVLVDAFVTRDGQPLLGLQAANFALRDEGVLQQVELVAVESQPLVALLVFDASSSVAGPKLAALRSASAALLAGLRPQDLIGLVCFSHELRLLARPSPDRTLLQQALDAMRAEGGTALWDALHAALTLLPTRSRALVVLFSDGEDNLSFLDETQIRTQAERSSAVVHVVGVRPDLPLRSTFESEQVRALRQTAEATGGRFWSAESLSRLQDAFAGIAAAMNTRYILRYEPRPRPAAGWHEIEVTLRNAKGEVRARRGYFRPARTPPPG